MSATIPQPYQQAFPISTDPFIVGDAAQAMPPAPLISSSSNASSSLLFSTSSTSTPGRLSTISPMTQDTAALPFHPPPPPSAVSQPPPSMPAPHAGSNTNHGFYQGPIQQLPPHGPVFPLDAAGVDLYHGLAGHHHHQPSLVAAPPAPVLLPSQHDILHATLNNETLTGSNTPNNTNMDGSDIPRHYSQTSTTLPSIERPDQAPGSQAPPSPRPRRRGRKPKNYNLVSSSSSSVPSSSSATTSSSATPGDASLSSLGSNEFDSEGLPKDPRRRRILERNRIAATKCRVRKRDEASALASKEQAMEDQNRALATCFDSLTAEIYHLKTELLRHTDCDCVLIQKYIANEARKSVDNIGNTSPHHPPTMGAAVAAVSGLIGPTAGGGNGGSASPHHYGGRLGSSAGSSVDSVSLRGREEDPGGGMPGHGPIPWSNPFLQNVAAMPPVPSTSNPHIPPPPPLLHQQSSLESTSSDPMAPPTSVFPMTPVTMAGFGDGLCIGVGTHAHPVNDVGWDYQWNFQQ